MIDERLRRPLVADAIFSRLMDVLTGGSFLAGLGLFVGADNFALGLIAALPFLAQVVQLPTVAILLRWPDRRLITVVCGMAARLLLVAIAAALVLRPSALTSEVLIAILAASAVLTVVATAAWNWWMRDLIPASEMGGLFSRRLRGATLASLAAMLVAGAALDDFSARDETAIGYAVLFGLAAAFGLAGVYALYRTPHVAAPPSPPARQSLRLIPKALRSAPRGLVPALSLVAVAAAFALPFSAVFLLRGLGYSFLAATAMAVVSQLAYIGGLRTWGYLSDQQGDRAVLGITLGILAVCMAGWAVAGWSSPGFLVAWIAMLHFFVGFALGGIELAGTNLLLRSAPADNVAGHLAAVSVVRAACGGAAVLAAGAAWQWLGPDVLWSADLGAFGVWQLRGFQVLCLAALALTVGAMFAVTRMPSPRPGHILEVARTMRSEVHQMSSVAGIRGIIHAVSYSVELLAWPFAARTRRRQPKIHEDSDPER